MLSTNRPTLKYGDRGRDVYNLQLKLRSIGFSLILTSEFDYLTEDAVKSFQVSYGLAVDGIVGDRTWRLLDLVTRKR